MAFGELTWPDGNEGILHVGVTNMLMRKPDAFSGQVTTMSTTSVFYSVIVRCDRAIAGRAQRRSHEVT